MAQLGDYLIGSTLGEMDLRENQAGVREGVFALTQHFDGFWSDVALGDQSTAQYIACGHRLGIEIQSLARFVFRLLESV